MQLLQKERMDELTGQPIITYSLCCDRSPDRFSDRFFPTVFLADTLCVISVGSLHLRFAGTQRLLSSLVALKERGELIASGVISQVNGFRDDEDDVRKQFNVR